MHRLKEKALSNERVARGMSGVCPSRDGAIERMVCSPDVMAGVICLSGLINVLLRILMSSTMMREGT